MVECSQLSEASPVIAIHSDISRENVCLWMPVKGISQRLVCLRGDFWLAFALTAFNDKLPFHLGGMKSALQISGIFTDLSTTDLCRNPATSKH